MTNGDKRGVMFLQVGLMREILLALGAWNCIVKAAYVGEKSFVQASHVLVVEGKPKSPIQLPGLPKYLKTFSSYHLIDVPIQLISVYTKPAYKPPQYYSSPQLTYPYA